MPERRDPPPTDEGWYALHDFRTVDWDAWEAATDGERKHALETGVTYLRDCVALEDAEEGASAVYSVMGHKADLLILHLRPTTAHLDALERGFETTTFARYTDQETSYVSVTEASGYSERAREYFEGDLDENAGLANYIRSRLHPTIPEAEHVCFYPMDKRRQPEQNWYSLPFDERAEHMDAHGEIGRDYGGRVTQMITGSIGLDDWEWGVTLWADALVDVKDLLYEMRFDASTAEFAEFGSFYVGRAIAPDDLPALLAGEVVPADGDASVSHTDTAEAGGSGSPPTETAIGEDQSGQPPETESAAPEEPPAESTAEASSDSVGPPPEAVGGDASSGATPESTDAEDMTARLATLGLHRGSGFQPDQYGVICYSDADAQELAAEVGDLRDQFDHYDTHVKTAVRAQAGRSAIASAWETERAADTAAGFLVELPGVGESVTGPLGQGVTTADENSDATAPAPDESEPTAGADPPDDGEPAAAADETAAENATEDPPADAGEGATVDGSGDSETGPAGDADVAAAVDALNDATGEQPAPPTNGSAATNGAASEADTASAESAAEDEARAEDDGAVGDAGDAADAARGDDAAPPEATAGADEDGDGDEDEGAISANSDDAAAAVAEADTIREELADLDVYAGQPHGEDIYALVCYSEAKIVDLTSAVSDLSEGFDRYDTHEGTDVYIDQNGDRAAVVSLWATKAAADTASGFLMDLPGVIGWADDEEGFGTMGMFYTVKPEHRTDFVETFNEVGSLLAGLEGHRESRLLENVENENDMFIASQWDAKEDAMAFFRSEAFRETVTWGRDVLADRPRHVFLA